MQTLTVAMIAYCVAFAVLIFGLSIYRGMKRRREMQMSLQALSGAASEQGEAKPPSPPSTESPHGAPPAKAA
jgi:hypothetical protein